MNTQDKVNLETEIEKYKSEFGETNQLIRLIEIINTRDKVSKENANGEYYKIDKNNLPVELFGNPFIYVPFLLIDSNPSSILMSCRMGSVERLIATNFYNYASRTSLSASLRLSFPRLLPIQPVNKEFESLENSIRQELSHDELQRGKIDIINESPLFGIDKTIPIRSKSELLLLVDSHEVRSQFDKNSVRDLSSFIIRKEHFRFRLDLNGRNGETLMKQMSSINPFNAIKECYTSKNKYHNVRIFNEMTKLVKRIRHSNDREEDGLIENLLKLIPEIPLSQMIADSTFESCISTPTISYNSLVNVLATLPVVEEIPENKEIVRMLNTSYVTSMVSLDKRPQYRSVIKIPRDNFTLSGKPIDALRNILRSLEGNTDFNNMEKSDMYALKNNIYTSQVINGIKELIAEVSKKDKSEYANSIQIHEAIRNCFAILNDIITASRVKNIIIVSSDKERSFSEYVENVFAKGINSERTVVKTISLDNEVRDNIFDVVSKPRIIEKINVPGNLFRIADCGISVSRFLQSAIDYVRSHSILLSSGERRNNFDEASIVLRQFMMKEDIEENSIILTTTPMRSN